MQKYARVENRLVIETLSIPSDVNIENYFVPQIVQQFIACPDEVEQNWTYEDGEWKEPKPPEPLEPPKPPEPHYETRIGKAEFLMLFTSEERVAIRAERNNDPIISDFFLVLEISEFIDVKEDTAINGVNYLVSKNLLTPQRAAAILKGKLVGGVLNESA